MSDEPKPQHVVAGTILICGILALAFGGDVRRTETYQRMFNAEQWAKKQQLVDENRERQKELDRMECSAKVRFEAELIPVRIERMELQGTDPSTAERTVMAEFAIDQQLCEERGM